MAERKQRPTEDVVYLDEDDRQAILARMSSMEPPMSRRRLAGLCNVSPAAITLLLSKPIAAGKTRACRFTSRLQRALGVTLTARKRALVVTREAAYRAEQIAQRLSTEDPEKLEHWLRNGEMLANKR